MVFTEYEQIPNKKANGIFSTATLPENAERSRIREVVPYEENRVELIPTKENNTGYINASHIKVRGVSEAYGKIPVQAKLITAESLSDVLICTKPRRVSCWFVTHRCDVGTVPAFRVTGVFTMSRSSPDYIASFS